MLSIWVDSVDIPRGLSSSDGLSMIGGANFLKGVVKIIPETIEDLDSCHRKLDRVFHGSYDTGARFKKRPDYGYILFYEGYKGVYRVNGYIELSSVVSEIRNNKIDRCLDTLS